MHGQLGAETLPVVDFTKGKSGKISEAQRLAAEAIARVCTQGATEDAKSDMPAGYTYFGQLMAHDFSFSSFPDDDFRNFGPARPGPRSPIFDLDCLYGGGPENSPWLYSEPIGAKSRFLLGRVGEDFANMHRIAHIVDPADPMAQDFPRLRCPWNPTEDRPDRNGPYRALTPDTRNLDTIIIAQISVLFLRLHNTFDKILRAKGGNVGKFDQARQLTEQTYQALIFEDYLYRLLDPGLYQDLIVPFLQGKRLGAQSVLGYRRAAVRLFPFVMRMGHFMVRSTYKFTEDEPPAKLSEVMKFGNPNSTVNTPVPANWVLEFDRFFSDDRQDEGKNFAHPIDGKITEGIKERFEINDAGVKREGSIIYTDVMRWLQTRPRNDVPDWRNVRHLTELTGNQDWTPAKLIEELGIDHGLDMFLTQANAVRHSTDDVSREELDTAIEDLLEDISPALLAIIECNKLQTKNGSRLGPIASKLIATACIMSRGDSEYPRKDNEMRELLGLGEGERLSMLRVVRFVEQGG